MFTGKGTKLRKGQLVQGVVISVDKKRGTVGLKASSGLVATNMVLFVLFLYCIFLVSDTSKTMLYICE